MNFKLEGLSLAPLESCTITLNVPVTVTENGAFTNTTGPISSTESGPSATGASASLPTFLLPPLVSKSFDKAQVNSGEIVRMTVTLSEPNAPRVFILSPIPLPGLEPVIFSSLEAASVTDQLPPGLAVAPAPNTQLSPICQGSVGNGTAGSTALTFNVHFTGGQVPNYTLSCSWSIDLVSTGVIGTLTNTTGAPTSAKSTARAGVSASASLIVTGQAPTMSKTFAATTITPGQPLNLTFTVTNPNATPLTSVTISDSLPAGMLVATPNGLVNGCGGAVNAPAGGNAITLTGGTVAANSTCQLTVAVVASAAGALVNTASFSTAEGGQGATATANLSVLAAASPTPGAGPATPTPQVVLKPVVPVIPQVFQNPGAQGIFNGPRNPAATPQPLDPRPAAVASAASLPVVIQPPRTGDAGLRSAHPLPSRSADAGR